MKRVWFLYIHILTWKNKHSLILSSLSTPNRHPSAPKTKIIFKFLWRILEGQHNRAQPSQPILKNCRNGTFLPVDKIWNFFGPSFEALWKCHFVILSKMRISMWIKVNKWNYLRNPSQLFKNYFCFRCLWISRKTGRQSYKVLILLC